MNIDELFEFKINRQGLSWNISSVEIKIKPEFKNKKYTYNDIIKNLLSRWIISSIDPEKIPLFSWQAFLLIENNGFSWTEEHYIYVEQNQISNLDNILYKNNSIKLNCLTILKK